MVTEKQKKFTRVYAAYGRVFILSFIILEAIMDKKRPQIDIKIIG
jgi:drug/metabolite transporter superfamily protein YnfA